MQAPRLDVTSLAKDFGAGPVLADVSFRLAAGRMLGVVGENGAGKSTLAKILAGVHAPTAGSIRVDGRPRRFASPAQARRAGVALVPQEFSLVPDLTVCENVFLGQELCRRGGWLDRRAMRERTAALLGELGASIDPLARVGALGASAKQMIELARGCVHDCGLLILDEPTTVLSPAECARLFARLRALRSRGMAMLLVSHRLTEVLAECDDVLVLRDGRTVSQGPAAELTPTETARRMVGRELTGLFPPRAATEELGPPLLEVRDLQAVRGAPRGVSFTVRRGEILGLAGLAGSGRTELAETLVGLRPKSGGCVRIDGSECTLASPADALRCGLALLSEDRQAAGILPDFGIAANITLATLRRFAHPFIDRASERRRATAFMQDFRIRARDPDQPAATLSGGNQQKVCLARALEPSPTVLIADEPTRGVDVGAKQEIYGFLRGATRAGRACLLISSELEEVIGLSDRVAVMRDGRLVAVLEGNDLTAEQVILHATGVAPRPTTPAPPHADTAP